MSGIEAQQADIQFDRIIDRSNIPKPDNITDCLQDFLTGDLIETDTGDFPVAQFAEGGIIPENLAKWLKYWSYTDGTIRIQTEGDITRFGDVSQTQEQFLSDHGGRRLSVVFDPVSGNLAAASWLHALQGDESDVDLVQACDDYAVNNNQPEIDPNNVATLAVRVYNGFRDRRIGSELLRIATPEYYDVHQGCKGVIIRASRTLKILKFFETYTDFEHMLKIPPRGDGVVMMLHTRPKTTETPSLEWQE